MTYHQRREEEQIQIAIVGYLRAVLPHDWIVHHSRNGGMSKGENGRAKAMGAVAGWPDIEIAGRERYGVLSIPALFFLEVKTETGKLNLKQKKLHPRLRQLGFKVAVVRSIDDVRDALIAWRIPRLEAGYAPSNHGDAA